MLAGCALVGPDYSPPSPTSKLVPAGFGAKPPGLDPGAVEAAWWRAFDDPALDALIRQALVANHDIGIAVARLEEARALLGETRQRYLPRGATAFGYESRRRSEIETPPGQPRSVDSYRGAIDASWEIDLFGRVRRSVQAAQALAGSREALLRGVQAGVAAEVAATWFELQGIEAELAVVADISQSQRESLGMVEGLMRAGSATEFDRLRAEALLRQAEVAAPELERRRAAAVNALAVLLGEAAQTFRPPAVPPAPDTLEIRTIAVGDPAGLLARRADIAAAERSLAAATARIGVETAGLYPDIQLNGSIGLVAGSLDAMNDGSRVRHMDNDMDNKHHLAKGLEESGSRAPQPASGTCSEGVFALAGKTGKVTAELLSRTTGPLARELSIAFTDKATGQPITRFDEELSHELHVLATDSDFSSLVHEHADKPGHDGRFRVTLNFPKPGTYHVYADAVPAGIGQQVVRFELPVDVADWPDMPEQAAGEATGSTGSYTIRLDTATLRAGTGSMMTLTILKDGKPASDLAHYLGVPAHAVFVNTRDLAYVHAHAMPAKASGSGQVTHASHGDPGAAVPPVLDLHATLPCAGRYALWVQFNGGGRVRTVPAVVIVPPGARPD